MKVVSFVAGAHFVYIANLQRAAIAQWQDQQTALQEVLSSNPTARTNNFSTLFAYEIINREGMLNRLSRLS